MKITKEDFRWATSEGYLSTDQAETLWDALELRHPSGSRFNLANVVYYFGALVVISAMTWFMTLGWERFGGGGIFLISLAYGICFVLVGFWLWRERGIKVPGGLLVTAAVWMTPLAIYGLEKYAGLWPKGNPASYQDYYVWIKGSWILMEISTVIAGLIALRFIQFPFLTAPISFSLWFLSMDITPFLLGKDDFTWDERRWVSLLFGLAMLMVTYCIDRRTKEDYAFWGYLFGLMAFWGGLTLMRSDSELSKFLYCMVNIGLVFLSVFLDRKAFVVFGSLGVFGYLGHLAYDVFKNSMVFPFALSLIGLGIIYLGIQYQRHHEAIQQWAFHLLPEGLRKNLPSNRVMDR
ncbi:MAG: DUF2157 domain-containing protein [Nitrospiria bacterium]